MRYWIPVNRGEELVEVHYSSLLHPIRAFRDFKKWRAANLVTTAPNPSPLKGNKQ